MLTITSKSIPSNDGFKPSTKRIALICTLLFFAISERAQAIPQEQISCQQDEVTIFPGLPPRVIDNTRVTLNLTAQTPVIVNDNRCIATFSTEAATNSPRQQLMILQYQLEIILSSAPNQPVRQLLFLDGPVLTQINGGLDETHTFKSLLGLPIPEGMATITVNLRPAIQSALNGPFRLRRRCLIVECDTQ
jgi:hypothetical protein